MAKKQSNLGKKPPKRTVDEKKADAFLDKGGDTTADKKEPNKNPKSPVKTTERKKPGRTPSVPQEWKKAGVRFNPKLLIKIQLHLIDNEDFRSRDEFLNFVLEDYFKKIKK